MVVAEPEPESVIRAAAAVHAQADSSATLAEIVCQARRCLPEFEHVSVSRIRPDGTLETLVAGTDLARSFDEAQSSARQGPCSEATDDDLVVVRDARHEQRWPAYISQATKLGLLSQIGVRLRSDAHGVICLNLHSTTHADIDAGSVGVAEHFGVHAGLALGHVLKEEQLSTAIGTRTVIGTAVGIMMERYGMTQAAAFSFLVRQASTENRKVRLIASEVLGTVEDAARDGSVRRAEAIRSNQPTPPSPEETADVTPAAARRVYVDMVGDLFHAGHVSLLREARRHGDWLVVGVLSDDTAASYKRRPIMTLAERVAVIGSCRYVDEVIADAPFRLTEDFLAEHAITTVVHGDDLSPEGAESIYGPAVEVGNFVSVPRTGGISTTQVIERVLGTDISRLI